MVKVFRRVFAAVTVAVLAFRSLGSFLSWVERQDDQPAEAWLDEEDLDESELEEA